jgi:hypothetical protein
MARATSSPSRPAFCPFTCACGPGSRCGASGPSPPSASSPTFACACVGRSHRGRPDDERRRRWTRIAAGNRTCARTVTDRWTRGARRRAPDATRNGRPIIQRGAAVPRLVTTGHTLWNWTDNVLFGLRDSGGPLRPALFVSITPSGRDIVTGGTFGPDGSLIETAVLLIGLGVIVWRIRAPLEPDAEVGVPSR